MSKSSFLKQPPLETTQFEEVDSEGNPIQVIRHRRGGVTVETRHFTSLASWADDLEGLITSAREYLTAQCEYLRNELEKRGLPSDRTPQWMSQNGGRWQPYRGGHFKLEPNTRYRSWTAHLNDLTEPASTERAVAEYLDAVSSLLESKISDEDLFRVTKVMDAYAMLKMQGPINCAAAEGIAARNARKQGPRKKQEQSDKIRKILAVFAESFWSGQPIYRGDASNTIAKNLSVLNRKLREEGLIKKDLSGKTLADHLRAAMRG